MFHRTFHCTFTKSFVFSEALKQISKVVNAYAVKLKLIYLMILVTHEATSVKKVIMINMHL